MRFTDPRQTRLAAKWRRIAARRAAQWSGATDAAVNAERLLAAAVAAADAHRAERDYARAQRDAIREELARRSSAVAELEAARQAARQAAQANADKWAGAVAQLRGADAELDECRAELDRSASAVAAYQRDQARTARSLAECRARLATARDAADDWHAAYLAAEATLVEERGHGATAAARRNLVARILAELDALAALAAAADDMPPRWRAERLLALAQSALAVASNGWDGYPDGVTTRDRSAAVDAALAELDAIAQADAVPWLDTPPAPRGWTHADYDAAAQANGNG